MKRRLKVFLTISVLVGTIAAFILYFKSHPEHISQLRTVSPLLLLSLIGLYGLFIVNLAYIFKVSLEIIKVPVPWGENFLLTAYSSIINFFGPFQSGPGVRLVYLKQKYGVSIKQFMFTALVIYGFYALFSGVLLSVNSLPWWLTVPFLAAIAGLSYVVIKKKSGQALVSNINYPAIAKLAIATVIQMLILTTLYFTELHSINPDITFWQAMTYTGAANFALFVSLTPGAIGFRESFLLFTEKLHGIEPAQVLSASLIDRGANVAFLGLLFLVTISLHARERFNVRGQTKQPQPTKSNAKR